MPGADIEFPSIGHIALPLPVPARHDGRAVGGKGTAAGETGQFPAGSVNLTHDKAASTFNPTMAKSGHAAP